MIIIVVAQRRNDAQQRGSTRVQLERGAKTLDDIDFELNTSAVADIAYRSQPSL